MTDPAAGIGGRPAGEDALLRAVRRVFGGLAGLLVLAMMGVTVVDVVGRYGFDRPLPGASELTEVMLGTMIFAALPLVVLEDGHITTTLLAGRLSPRARRAQGALVSLFGGLVLALIAWRLYRHGAQLASYGDVTVFLHLPRGPLAFLVASLTAAGAVAAVALALRFATGRAGDGRCATDRV